MSRFTQGLITFILGAVVIAALWFSTPEHEPFPELTFNLVDGKPITSQDLKGRPVMLSFWSVTCSTCIADIPALNQLHEILDRRGGKLIGVNLPSDPPPTAISMSKKYEIAYPNALDVHGEINKALGGVSVTPTHLFINREGKIVQRHTGAVNLNDIGLIISTL